MAIRRGLALSATADPEGQYSGRVLGLNALGVQAVAQEQLPEEFPARTFEELYLDTLGHGGGTPLGPHSEHVALNIEIDLCMATLGRSKRNVNVSPSR